MAIDINALAQQLGITPAQVQALIASSSGTPQVQPTGALAGVQAAAPQNPWGTRATPQSLAEAYRQAQGIQIGQRRAKPANPEETLDEMEDYYYTMGVDDDGNPVQRPFNLRRDPETGELGMDETMADSMRGFGEGFDRVTIGGRQYLRIGDMDMSRAQEFVPGAPTPFYHPEYGWLIDHRQMGDAVTAKNAPKGLEKAFDYGPEIFMALTGAAAAAGVGGGAGAAGGATGSAFPAGSLGEAGFASGGIGAAEAGGVAGWSTTAPSTFTTTGGFDAALGGATGNFPATAAEIAAANAEAAAAIGEGVATGTSGMGTSIGTGSGFDATAPFNPTDPSTWPQTPPTPPGNPSGSNAPGGAAPATPPSTPPTGTAGLTNFLSSLGISPSVIGTIVSALMGSGGDGGDPAAGVNSANQMAAIAADQWNYYKTHYQPLETNLINQAMTAGSPEEFARASGKANADVTGAFNQAQKQTESRLQSYGINPAAPAYQAAMGSTDLAKGATMAGAQTTAADRVRDLAYSKAVDVVGLGRNIPAQSAASAGAASNAATNASRNQFLQNQSNMQARGQFVAPIVNALGKTASSWFGESSPGGASYAPFQTPYGSASMDPYGGSTDWGFAKGGIVGTEQPEAEKRMRLKVLLMKRGMSDEEAERQSRMAVTRRYARGGLVKKPITPHMRGFKPPSMYADGGGVGRQGMAMPDASDMGEMMGPGTETSDSIPAVIDGQQPAALSTGEVVMNADAVELSGKEIFEAINQAGMKRRSNGLDTMGGMSMNPGVMSYNRGGRVSHASYGLRR